MSSFSSQRWCQRQKNDPYVKLRQKAGYRSRAAFKLLQLHEKYRLFSPNQRVIDIGAAPGGWSQMLAQWIGPKGQVFAIDCLPMDPLPGVQFLQGDFTDPDVHAQLLALMQDVQLDWVVSDIAPNISGIRAVDQARMMHLCELCLDLAHTVLKPKGGLIVKIFQGEGFDEFRKQILQHFRQVKIFKPDASRNESREMYLIARDYNV